jgi:hypothetical protein
VFRSGGIQLLPLFDLISIFIIKLMTQLPTFLWLLMKL